MHQMQRYINPNRFPYTLCPPGLEDATFELLKGFENPQQVVNMRPSATRLMDVFDIKDKTSERLFFHCLVLFVFRPQVGGSESIENI